MNFLISYTVSDVRFSEDSADYQDYFSCYHDLEIKIVPTINFNIFYRFSVMGVFRMDLDLPRNMFLSVKCYISILKIYFFAF
ncbi:MAG: hypothetical protein BGO88_00655 [Flavobacterium sp. 38-13]|nr:MAG: hypothetical protein BGO88_00655 [Flavobacterium sp. 38-13]